jgi:hypothetical protein
MFAELGGAVSSQQGDGSVGFWATEIETTLGALTSRDVDLMAQRVGDLPPMIASLVETRRKDMLLALSFEQADEQRAEHDPRRSLPALLDLRAAGVDDPNVNLWIGFLTDDTDLAAEAIAAGADRSLTVEQIVAQHKIKH